MVMEANEKVLEKLRKLYRLSIQGVGGEAENATMMLNQFLEKYGMTIQDIDENVKSLQSFYIKKKLHTLLCNCFVNYFGGNERFTKDLHVYNLRGNSRQLKVEIDCTPWEFAEFQALWEFHSTNYEKEWRKIRKTFASAYISKHNLYAQERDDWFNKMMAERKQQKPGIEEMFLREGLEMAMSDTKYRRQIGE